MATSDLQDLVDTISSGKPLKAYMPEDREAEAAKIARLRQLRLAKHGKLCPMWKPLRGLIITR
jgi:hypothetical protein